MADKKIVQDTVTDLVVDFLYYDRKEDEALPRGEIERLVKADEVTAEDIVAWFRAELFAQLAAEKVRLQEDALMDMADDIKARREAE